MAAIARSSRTVKKLEKPRPLKITPNQNRYSTIDGRISTVEDIMVLADAVSSQLANGNFDQLLQFNVIQLCANLKQYGQQLEAVYKDQLDRCFVAFRNGCRDEKVDYISRINLLEMIELRARNWVSSEDLNNYYRSKLNIVDSDAIPVLDASTLSVSPTILNQSVSPVVPQTSLLNPGEVIKASGKFAKPTKIPGKNYCKDEVVIRNSDSGKVMGIKGRRVHMIEELSETIISFQRVNPGAKERLVQITGPNEEKINYAKHLMEDTIRRNASPVRLEPAEKERVGDSSSSLNSSASDDSNRLSLGAGRNKLLHSFSTNDATLEYKYTVSVGENTVKITGTNLDLVWTAKLILDDFFNKLEHSPNLVEFEQFPELEVTASSEAVQAPTATSARVDGIDSGATSESEETFKAPTVPGALAQSPSYEFVPAAGDAASHLAVMRQPLFPSSSKEAFQQVELSERASDIGARSRRALFSQTNSQQQLSRSDSNVGTEETGTVHKDFPYVYSHEQLLSFAMSEHVRRQPPDWERISKEYPSIVNKTIEEFDPIIYSQKWHEIEVMTSVISATEIDPADIE